MHGLDLDMFVAPASAWAFHVQLSRCQWPFEGRLIRRHTLLSLSSFFSFREAGLNLLHAEVRQTGQQPPSRDATSIDVGRCMGRMGDESFLASTPDANGSPLRHNTDLDS